MIKKILLFIFSEEPSSKGDQPHKELDDIVFEDFARMRLQGRFNVSMKQ